MELWSQIRRRIRTGEISMRQACIEYHLNFRTIRKIVLQPEPTPFHAPPPRPKKLSENRFQGIDFAEVRRKEVSPRRAKS